VYSIRVWWRQRHGSGWPVPGRHVVLPALIALFLVTAAATCLASDQLVDQARDLVERRKNEAALPLLEQALEADKTNPEVYHLMAKVLLRMQRHDEAARCAERAIELDDSISDYYLWLARAYLAKAMESGVINAFRYARKGKSMYEKALACDSSNVEARLELSMYLVAAPGIVGGDREEGKRQARLVECQDSLYGAYAWASVYEREEAMDKAEAALRRAVELDTSSTYYARYALGYFLERNGQYDEAVRVFREILDDRPDELNAVFQVGKICVVTESDLDEAERCFKRYLEVEAPPNAPSWAAAHWRLGMVYEIQGKLDLALIELRKAVELAPQNKEFQKALKDVEKKAKQ
jgi:tetratricopeptide (TPR) repeat protein